MRDTPSQRRRAARTAVARGTKVLDKILPGWAGKIDLDRLSLDDGEECVLGQLFSEPQTRPAYEVYGYGTPTAMKNSYRHLDGTKYECDPHAEVCVANYQLGKIVLKEAYPFSKSHTEDLAVRHGFQAGEIVGYGDLDEAWAEVIKERQKVAV